MTARLLLPDRKRRSAATAKFAPFPTSVNLLPPERNREAMDDDELIAAMVSGDDTAL